jgi:hypothetical protein
MEPTAFRMLATTCFLLAVSLSAKGSDEVMEKLKSARAGFARYQMVAGTGGMVRQGDVYKRNIDGLIEEAKRDIEYLQIEIDKFGRGAYSGKGWVQDLQRARRTDLNALTRERDRMNQALPDRTDRRAIANATSESKKEAEGRFKQLSDAAIKQFGEQNAERGIIEKMNAAGWRRGVVDALGSPDEFLVAFRAYLAEHPAPNVNDAAKVAGDGPGRRAVRQAADRATKDPIQVGNKFEGTWDSIGAPEWKHLQSMEITSREGNRFTAKCHAFAAKGVDGRAEGTVQDGKVKWKLTDDGRMNFDIDGEIKDNTIEIRFSGTAWGGRHRQGTSTYLLSK